MNGSHSDKLEDCLKELRRISEWIDDNKFDGNVKFLTSYSVIKACGTIEIVLKDMLFLTISKGGTKEAQSYLRKQIIDASFNPSFYKIQCLLNRMNKEWKNKLTTLEKSKEQKQLDSLVDLRNSFAHGTPISGASVSQVIEYFNSGYNILMKLYEIITPDAAGK